MKNLKNLGKSLSKNEQKEIYGGMLTIQRSCGCSVSDPRCCGTARNQCGVGRFAGGLFLGYDSNGDAKCGCC